LTMAFHLREFFVLMPITITDHLGEFPTIAFFVSCVQCLLSSAKFSETLKGLSRRRSHRSQDENRYQ
jgi:hypothetical protein